jgi:hypothetical protein
MVRGDGSLDHLIRPRFLQHFWQELLKGSGLRYRKFHSTRHLFITWAAEGCEALGIAPTPILAVRDWAGHSSVQETGATSTESTGAPTPATWTAWTATFRATELHEPLGLDAASPAGAAGYLSRMLAVVVVEIP